MLKIGLTGGIGSGKSTVARLFSALAVPVADADIIAHQLVAVGQPALAKITQCFGTEIITQDGSLNRAKLRELIHANPQKKQQLEAILHPAVYQALTDWAATLQAPYCIMAIPLLFETRMTSFVDRVLVVDCPTEIQVMRVQERDHLSLDSIAAIMANQVSREFRKAHADDLIDNSGPDSALAEQVKKLHNFYLSISHR